jgi:hypothetical protein
MTILSDDVSVANIGKPHIYILKDVGNKALKIGFSIDCNKRFLNHSTANPFLKLIVVIPVENQAVERKLHKQMIAFRIPGTREWYSDSLFFRNILDVFFVLDNIVSDSIIELTTKFLPDADDAFDSYIPSKISDHYVESLIIQAWLEEKPMAEIAGNILAFGLEKSYKPCRASLAHIAKSLGLSVDKLKAGILNGTIAPLSSHSKD